MNSAWYSTFAYGLRRVVLDLLLVRGYITECGAPSVIDKSSRIDGTYTSYDSDISRQIPRQVGYEHLLSDYSPVSVMPSPDGMADFLRVSDSVAEESFTSRVLARSK